MSNLLLETSRYYFFKIILLMLTLFAFSTIVRAVLKMVKLTQEELAALNVAKKCQKLGLELEPENNAVILDGVGTFPLHNIVDGDPSKLVFGIVNLNNEGKKYEVALNKTSMDSWEGQATQDVKFVVTSETLEKKKFLKIKMQSGSESIQFKSKNCQEVNFLCEL